MANDNTQFFIKELAFEQALANLLHTSHGWGWRNHDESNRGRPCTELGEYPL